MLGFYDPRAKGVCKVDAEKIKHWISKGVQLSGTVKNFLIEQKIITGKKVNVLPKKTVPKKEEPKEEAKTEAKAEAKETPASVPEAKVETEAQKTEEVK